MRHSTFILSLLICFAGAVSAADDVLRIMLEEPVAGEIHGGVGNLRGWAVATAGIDKIEIMIDGEYAFDAPYGGARGDVGGAFPGVANASQSGFSLAYAYSNLSPGSHTITAVAHTLDGETQM
ncbi:MAG: Ig-like domain-containing protein, partial [Halieaceae bacterium]|nr:Ig-like domain-containing protein [Halieaceae bacterium]